MNPVTYEKIEAYLAKRLPESERKKFETEISSDASLKEMVVSIQLLRKITERNLMRSKILTIHNVKTSEWVKKFTDDDEKEFVEQVTLLAPEGDSIIEEATTPDQKLALQEAKLTRKVTAKITSKAESAWEETSGYERYKEPSNKQGRTLPIVLSILGLILVIGTLFVYFAKTPLIIRGGSPLLTAQGVTLDSTQQVYLEIYDEGVQVFKEGNDLTATAHFDNVISFGRLPSYYTDASRFLNSAAFAQQQPNKASRLFSSIISRKSFAYPYTNKDKVQIWCKIYWAKVMGFND
jgi:TolA-binding protein